MSGYENLSSKLTDQKSGVTFTFWRLGKLAYIKAEGSAVALTAGWNTLATIPSGYRPPNYIYGLGMANELGAMCETSITGNNGAVRIYSGKSATGYVRLSLVFPMA